VAEIVHESGPRHVSALLPEGFTVGLARPYRPILEMLLSFLEKLIIKVFNLLCDASYTLRLRFSERHRVRQTVVLGEAASPFQPTRTESVPLTSAQRLKSVYLLGGTGSGKTKSIEGMAVQDIEQGNGLTLIDPHGDLTHNVLRHIARMVEKAKLANDNSFTDSVIERLVLVEPFNPNWTVGFNPLECAEKKGSYSQVLEMMGIFRRLWGESSWGPRMDELLRNTLISLSECNLTLLEASPLLTDAAFRHSIIANVENEEAREYWQRYHGLSDKMQAAYREPVLNKISTFTSDPNIRAMLGQKHSTLNFREAMDEGKWILMNLSKGRLKENTFLLGSLLLAKLKLAAMSRVDTREESRRAHIVYVDEFQNFTGSDYDFETILSESRKFKLGLTIAHQMLGQITPQLRSAIFGNVCTLLFFRLSAHDAGIVAAEMGHKDKTLVERKLSDLGVGQAYLKIKGRSPMLLRTLHVSTPRVSEDAVERLKLLSSEAHARRRDEVEKEIAARREALLRAPARRAGCQSQGANKRQVVHKHERSSKEVVHGNSGVASDEGQSSW
jgi:hypothetical protein